LFTERRLNSIGIPSDRRGTLSLVHAAVAVFQRI